MRSPRRDDDAIFRRSRAARARADPTHTHKQTISEGFFPLTTRSSAGAEPPTHTHTHTYEHVPRACCLSQTQTRPFLTHYTGTCAHLFRCLGACAVAFVCAQIRMQGRNTRSAHLDEKRKRNSRTKSDETKRRDLQHVLGNLGKETWGNLLMFPI